MIMLNRTKVQLGKLGSGWQVKEREEDEGEEKDRW